MSAVNQSSNQPTNQQTNQQQTNHHFPPNTKHGIFCVFILNITPLKINGWNIIMEVWFRSCSFLSGWFEGSMLIFQGNLTMCTNLFIAFQNQTNSGTSGSSGRLGCTSFLIAHLGEQKQRFNTWGVMEKCWGTNSWVKRQNIWVFPKIKVSQNGWFIMETPIKNGWFGGTPIFGNTHIKIYETNRCLEVWTI